jgi:hypothetical protein
VTYLLARPARVVADRFQNTVPSFAEIEQHAAILGVSSSEFVRSRSLGYRLPASLAVQRHVAALAVALLRLGVNLNQVARLQSRLRDYGVE